MVLPVCLPKFLLGLPGWPDRSSVHSIQRPFRGRRVWDEPPRRRGTSPRAAKSSSKVLSSSAVGRRDRGCAGPALGACRPLSCLSADAGARVRARSRQRRSASDRVTSWRLASSRRATTCRSGRRTAMRIALGSHVGRPLRIDYVIQNVDPFCNRLGGGKRTRPGPRTRQR